MPAIASATIKATTLTGTLSTAAQPNVTSLGTLTALTVSGTTALAVVTLSSFLTVGANGYIIGNVTNGFRVNNAADTENNFVVTDAGVGTLRGGLTVSAGTTAVQALTATTVGTTGTITVNHATSDSIVQIGSTAAAGANAYVQLKAGTGGNAYINSIGVGALILGANGAASNAISIAASNAVTFAAGITATTGTFSGAVSLGNTVNAVSPTSPNRTITIVVGGTTYYLHAKTTND